jgi:hypothetical protein
MKELIGSALLIAGLFGAGSFAAKEIHNSIRKAALSKANQGMPSLVKLTRSLRGK